MLSQQHLREAVSGLEAAVLDALGFTPAGVAARIRMLLGRHPNERS